MVTPCPLIKAHRIASLSARSIQIPDEIYNQSIRDVFYFLYSVNNCKGTKCHLLGINTVYSCTVQYNTMYEYSISSYTAYQGVTKRCRLSWLTNSALVYEPKCGGRGVVAWSQPMSTYSCTQEPKYTFGDLLHI
jgi:hypothetical protein